jgi:hypothetical protein
MIEEITSPLPKDCVFRGYESYVALTRPSRNQKPYQRLRPEAQPEGTQRARRTEGHYVFPLESFVSFVVKFLSNEQGSHSKDTNWAKSL